MATTEAEGGTRPRAPLRLPSFRRYLLGLTIDLVGDQIWFIGLAWAADQAGGAGPAGVVVAAGTVPRMLLLLPAGVVVDRLGALPIAQAAQLVRVATMVGAFVIAVTDPDNVALLVAVALVFGIGDALRLPAAGVLPPRLLAAQDLPQGQGLVSTAGRVASVVAGPAAGLALALHGFPAVVIVNVVLFATAFVAFATLRGRVAPPPRPRGNRAGGLRAGLRYVVGRRDIMLTLMLVTALNLALVGPLNLGVVLRGQEGRWGPAGLGIVIGTFGVAAALGALSLTVSQPRRRPAVVGMAWSAVSAAAIVGLGFTPTVAASAAAAAVAGFALGPAGALLLGIVQATTDPAYLGRVMSLASFSGFGLTPFALLGFGFLAQAAGLPIAFLIAGSLVLVLTLFGASSPSLRAIALPRREPESGAGSG